MTPQPVVVAVADARVWHLLRQDGQAACGAALRNVSARRPHDSIEQAVRAVPKESAIHICTLCIVRVNNTATERAA